MIDFRNLEAFVSVATTGKFNLAAEILNTTQPAISARIALLENTLGARLLIVVLGGPNSPSQG